MKKAKPMQRTIHGHEIPVPTRRDFLRDLRKVAKPASRRRPSRPAK